MKYQRYADTDSFSRDVRDVLLKDEPQNFLMLSFLGNKTDAVKNWLLASVCDEDGNVVLRRPVRRRSISSCMKRTTARTTRR